MWITRHWKAALGILSIIPLAVTALWRTVGFIGDVDFVVTHVQDPGWIGKLATLLFKFREWSSIPILLAGLALIWWVVKRSSKKSQPVTPEYGLVVSTTAPLSNKPELRRLSRRADDMELLSLVNSSDRAFVLSHWKPNGADFSRIRVDAVRLDGSKDESFGQGGDGFVSFVLPGYHRSLAHRLTLLVDDHVLVVGTCFDDENKTSAAFVVKLLSTGSLDRSFGVGGIAVLSKDVHLNYGCDAVQSGDLIYCVVSTFDSAVVRIERLTLTGEVMSVIHMPLASSGMAWPSRIVATFPDNGFMIAGRLIEDGSIRTDGFVAKLNADCSLERGFADQGILMLTKMLPVPLVHQIFDVAVMPTGAILIAGSGNEGFVVGVDVTGRPMTTFGRSGFYETRAIYRTTATSFAYSQNRSAVSVAGAESDGNSINRPFIGLIDLTGRSLLPDDHDPIIIDVDAHSFRIEHVILKDGRTLIAIQEGALSSGRKVISIATIALMSEAASR